MINQGNDVPDNTIAVFYKNNLNMSDERLGHMLSKPDKKREWFYPNFYKCLPLAIGNTYGFIITAEYDFTVYWSGGEGVDDLKINIPDIKAAQYGHPSIVSNFGAGIFTVNTPFFIRTPPNVNIMTINPPNYILPLSTVMCGVVETDNLRKNFTFNVKVHVPDAEITFHAGHPIGAFIPIPRNYADNFELRPATEIFDKETVREEVQACQDADDKRDMNREKNPPEFDRDYIRGVDTYGNKFNNHQI
jgi:hypothetical protein